MSLLEWAKENMIETNGFTCPACCRRLDIDNERHKFECEDCWNDCCTECGFTGTCDVTGDTIEDLKKFIKRGKRVMSYEGEEK